MTTIHYPLKERWISPRDRVSGTRIRLFCLPHAGSGATAYQSWKRELPSFVELCAIRLPGRETRLAESSFSDSVLLVREMADVLAEDCDMPYAIFGHSMGAILAYEFAQELRSRGLKQPLFLFLSGRVAAHLKLPAKPLHDLPFAQFIEALEARYGGLPQELLQDQEMLDFYLPILRSDLRLIETYRYQAKDPLDCPLVVSAGLEDQSIWSEGLQEWKQHSTGNFSFQRFAGGHFYLSGESKQALLQWLSEQLVTADTKR